MRGEIIKAFIALREGFEPSDKLKEEIRLFVKQGLAAHAAPREIEFKDKLASENQKRKDHEARAEGMGA